VELPALCVDLDGTLVYTNTLLECFLLLLKRNPIEAFSALLSLVHGKARFKKEICRARLLKPETLPYNGDFLKYLRQQAASGRRLFLATGADTAVAHAVADHLNLFRGVICSDGQRNITGRAKAAAIADRLEGDPFIYAGNSRQDLPVWDAAHEAVIVDAPAACERASSTKRGVGRAYLPSTAILGRHVFPRGACPSMAQKPAHFCPFDAVSPSHQHSIAARICAGVCGILSNRISGLHCQ
jgi:phosphoserine phosphatase